MEVKQLLIAWFPF